MSSASRIRLAIAIGVLLVMGALIFTNLGHDAFWDDEATTVMFADNLWHHGDMLATRGHNIMAYGGGWDLKEVNGQMVNRAIPPLNFLLPAPFIGLLGLSEFSARLPSALCGLATVGLILWWLRRDGADTRLWAMMAVALVANVSLVLYSRQCRYYAPAMLASTAVVYLYTHWDNRWRTLLLMMAASLALWSANYLNWAALHACLLADYLLWQRKTRPLQWKHWAVYVLPQLAICALIYLAFTPPNKELGFEAFSPTWFERNAIFFALSFRDIDYCEFGLLVLIVAAPVVARFTGNRWLTRLFVAAAIYSAVVACMAPERYFPGVYAPVRQYAAVLPLYLALSVLCLYELTRRIPKLAIPIAGVLFLSTLGYGKFLWGEGVRCTLADYVHELRDPLPNNFRLVADWINKNVPEGQSVWTQPHFTPYPLIYLAPKPVYAWQLQRPMPALKQAFATLPKAHFLMQSLPDYIVQFGPPSNNMLSNNFLNIIKSAAKDPTLDYDLVVSLDVYWDYGLKSTKPELLTHRFYPVADYNPQFEAVYILRKVHRSPTRPATSGPGQPSGPLR